MVVDTIRDILQSLRSASIHVDIVTARGLMMGAITHHTPEVFENTDKNGSCFRCSDEFVRKFLKRTMGWSLHRSTHTGQKVPENADDLLTQMCLRAAAVIRDEDILPQFVVNLDQTQVVYSSDGKLTYNTIGEKQVQVEGKDEKRAFTLVVGVSMGGEALPFQVIYHSTTARSLPASNASSMDRARELRFRFEPSESDTYWSTQKTMRSYVTDILAPHFIKHKEALDRLDQKCLWLIDVWSVHCSLEFWLWMLDKYPWIYLNYVPAGCTGLG